MASSIVEKVKTKEAVYDIADTSARAKLDALRNKTAGLAEVNPSKCSIKDVATSYNNLLKAVQEAVAALVIATLLPMSVNAGIVDTVRGLFGAAPTVAAGEVGGVTPTWVDHNEVEGDRQTMSNSKAWTEAASTQINSNASAIAGLDTKMVNERKDNKGGSIPLSQSLKDYIDAGDTAGESAAKAIAAERTNKVDHTFIPVGTSIKEYFDDKTLNYYSDARRVKIGAGAQNPNNANGTIIINADSVYPSYLYGAFNICLGIDNLVGYKELDGHSSLYSVAIGTSDRAAGMHSYAFGSQINALEDNTTVVGYGLSATNAYSTVIGHGSRTIWDKHFDTALEMTNFLKAATCKNVIFKGYGILVGNGPGCSHIVEQVLATADPATGMFAKLRENPLDIEVGSRRWFYGQSHGRGTFNIVAIGDGVNNYGLANVFINDRSLADWTGINIGQSTDKEIYNMGIFGPGTSHCDHDYTVAIGDNAKATETASSCQSIAIGRDALSAGSATVAVGPNAFAIGAQAAALGWRANAVGAHSVAIGCAKKSGENYYKDGAINPNSDLCLAEGAESVAIGFNAKAKANKAIAIGDNAQALAVGSAQIGTGIVDKPNTLQFNDVVIVKEGKLVGNFDAKDLDPKNIYADPYFDTEIAVTCTPHRINTLTATKPMNEVEELAVASSGTRNFEMYIPNEANFREGLPFNLQLDLPPGVKHVIRGEGDVVGKLPIMIKFVEPVTNMVIITTESIPDGTDWAPVVDRCNMTYTIEKGFTCLGSTSLRGHNLQMATECLLTYPIEGGTFTTNILSLSSGKTYSGGTLYRRVSLSYTPPAGKLFDIDAGKTWFEIKYKTVNGEVSIPRVEVDILNPVVTYGLTGDVTWVDNSTTEVTGNGHFELACGSKYKVYKDDVQLSFMTNNVPCTNVLTSATYDATNNKFIFPDITGLTFAGNVSTNSLSFKTVDDERLTTLVHTIEK